MTVPKEAETFVGGPDKPVTMAVVAYGGVRPFQLSVPCEIFGEKHCDGVETELWVCAIEAGPLRTSAGFIIDTAHGLEDIPSANVVFIPSWHFPYKPPPRDLVDALMAAHANGAIIVGLCLGAYVLAELGLLDGKRATTHWAFSDDFRRRFPAVELDEKVLYVDEGTVLTSAGVTAGVDCCLHLARRLFGARRANWIARNVLALPHRAGGQIQFIDRPLAENLRDIRLRDMIEDIVQHLGRKYTIDSMAARLGMSRRSFTRHFQQTMGMSFSVWLGNERLTLAQRNLEATDDSVEQIALDAGFGSPLTFRVQFQKRLGVSPRQWRRSFRGAGEHAARRSATEDKAQSGASAPPMEAVSTIVLPVESVRQELLNPVQPLGSRPVNISR
ncbi:GlxA family transcriptional regulator [Rhizobium rhizogenes]|uniref:AraC family transcriptional regulator n=1 Tax=Rhizobium rhizogenes NBRC 13257 TaxID=1220581 RepID=A0AA87QGS9_RHIRH|nr:helix-turn-helix domain-containing protein [Rhizobium rhizogenes]GAJ96509.1 putative AraC family transcriptional regulator [Rhizobium rhizogenes NBRC 13257]